MKKVLIATTNDDKYRIVKNIFQATIFPEEELAYYLKYVKEALLNLDI